MTFHNLSVFTAVVCLVLFGLLFVDAGTYVETYGVARDVAAAFLGRRASPMFLGLAVMLWLGRHAPPSDLRNVLATGVAVIFAGIAVTGIVDYLSGVASVLIVAAAVAETLIALAFVVTRSR